MLLKIISELPIFQMCDRKLRSETVVKLGNQNYTDKDTFKPGLLPTGKDVIEMVSFVLRPKGKGYTQKTKKEAFQWVAETLVEHWVWCNLYQQNLQRVCQHIEKLFTTFQGLHRTSKSKQTDKWVEKRVVPFQEKASLGFDISTKDETFKKKCESLYGVKMTAQEELFLVDQTKGERKMYCENFVDKRWQAQVDRKNKEGASLAKRMELQKLEKEAQFAKVDMSLDKDDTEEDDGVEGVDDNNMEEENIKEDEELSLEEECDDGPTEKKRRKREAGTVKEQEGVDGMPDNFRHIRSSIRQVTLCYYVQ